MPKWRVVLAVAMLALSAAASSCGGDDGAQAASAEKERFIKQTDKACEFSKQQMLAAFTSAQEESGPEKNQTQYIEEVSQGAWFPQIRQAIGDIAELKAPEGDEEEVKAILKAMGDAVVAGEEKHIRSYDQFTKEFQRFNKLAYDYGLRVCLLVDSRR